MVLGQKTKYSLIGVVVALSLFILIWGLNYLKGKDIFTNDDMYNITYEHVGGLSQSSPVLLSGYKIGEVQSIKLDMSSMGAVDVVIGVNPRIKLPLGSIARIISTDLMGTKAIEIQLSEKQEFHSVGDTLLAATEESLKDQVSIQMLPLKHKAEDLLKEMEEAIRLVRFIFNEKTRGEIQNSFSLINSSTQNINNITKMLDTMILSQSGNMEAIVVNMRSLTDNLKSSNKDIRQTISNLSRTTDSLSKISFKHSFDIFERTMASMNQTIAKMERGEGTVGQLMQNDTLYNSLVEATQNLSKLTEDLRENPKKYLNFRVFDFSRGEKKPKK
jgi:phospholipid/cholesterol/gamma-HCH transport system substrate-binding protein